MRVRRLGGRATDREVAVVTAPRCRAGEGGRSPAGPVALDREAPPRERSVQGGAATTAQLVWILAPRLPEPEHEVGRTGGSTEGRPADVGRQEWMTISSVDLSDAYPQKKAALNAEAAANANSAT